jgi:hypothetical protein
MVFHEPKVEFIGLSPEIVTVGTGASYGVCQKVGDDNLNRAMFCKGDWGSFDPSGEMQISVMCGLCPKPEDQDLQF